MEDDLSLINRVKETGDSVAMSQLIAYHSGSYLNILERYLPSEQFSTQKEDLKKDRSLMIYQAALSFDADRKMKFPTYLAQTIKWKCLTLKNRGPDKDTIFLEDAEIQVPEKEEQCLDSKFKIEKIFEFAEKYPNELARKIINLRYNSNSRMKFKQIAKQLAVSVSWVALLHKEFIRDAKEYFLLAEQQSPN